MLARRRLHSTSANRRSPTPASRSVVTSSRSGRSMTTTTPIRPPRLHLDGWSGTSPSDRLLRADADAEHAGPQRPDRLPRRRPDRRRSRHHDRPQREHACRNEPRGAGIRNSGFDSVTITNGSVYGFEVGVLLGSGSSLNIVDRANRSVEHAGRDPAHQCRCVRQGQHTDR